MSKFHDEDFNTQLRNQWNFAIIGTLMALVAIFFWTYFAPLSSAVIATGTLKNDGHRHVIQHPEAAITERVFVRNGDTVKAGEKLLILDTHELRAKDLSLRIEYLQTKLEKNRHYAIIDGHTTLTFPENLLALAKQTDQRHRVALETSVWHENNASIDREIELLNIQQKSLVKELLKEEKLGNYWREQIAILGNDQSALTTLNRQSLVSRSQKSKVDHAMIELKKNRDITDHAIEELKAKIAQIPSKIEDIAAVHRQNSLKRYQALDTIEPKLVHQMDVIRKKIARSTLISPINGRVNNLTVNAEGGTIRANTSLLEIIPMTGELIVTAQISTRDIDSLSGLEHAKVRLSGLNPRHHHPLAAKIQSISADILHDASGKPFYEMQLAITQEHQTRLYPGMSTEIFIPTGKFSVFDFLIGRLVHTSEHALRETL